jgi:hypothetical protein
MRAGARRGAATVVPVRGFGGGAPEVNDGEAGGLLCAEGAAAGGVTIARR